MEGSTKERIHEEHDAGSAKSWSEKLWSENPGARAEPTRIQKDAVEQINV